MKAHRMAAPAACAIATAAALLTAVPASAAPARKPCTWVVEHTSSTNIRGGLALRDSHSDSAPLVKPRLPSRMLNGTRVTGDPRDHFYNKPEHIIWQYVTIVKLVRKDPRRDLGLNGWAAMSNGHGTRYLRQHCP